ncbi:hypothetical protein [Micromonospora sp. NPDC004704]
MSAPVDPGIQAAAVSFLRGDLSVVDYTYAFRTAMNKVVELRPLQDRELELFYALEEWEESGWAGRPDVVDRLRILAREMVDEA